MKRTFRTVLAGLTALMLAWASASAQGTVTPDQLPAAQPAATAPAQQPAFSPQQLDQLLAPIALYPDQLLGQILMASTYPLEVVEAARWLQDPQNAALKGDALAQALQGQDWDPSVKALIPYPHIVQMMSQQLDWMQSLGNAFLAQQGDVMNSIQHLRQEAQNAGHLSTTPQQVVQDNSGVIAIEPASPDVVYVPYYDPSLVFGSWPYSDYPPYYFPPPPGYVAGPGLFFGVSFPIFTAFWGWDSFDWHRRDIQIDRNRFNQINQFAVERQQRPAITGNTWQHDPYHRRGVAYSSPQVRQRFQGTPQGAGSPEARQAFRGYAPAPQTTAPAQGAARPPVQSPAQPPEQRTARPPVENAARRPVQNAARPPEQAPARPPAQTAVRPTVPPQTAARPPAVAPIQRPVTTPAIPHPVPAARPAPAPAPTTSLFGTYGHGSDARAQADRGRASIATPPHPTVARAPAPPPRPAVPAPPAPHPTPATHPAPAAHPVAGAPEPQQKK